MVHFCMAPGCGKHVSVNTPLSLSLRIASIQQLPLNDVISLLRHLPQFLKIAIAALAKSFGHIKVGKMFFVT